MGPTEEPIASFLSHRSLRVHEGTAISREVEMKAGTPQGSIVSPILFILFMDDLKDRLPESVKLYQFADDIALSATSECPRLAEIQIQQSLKIIEEWTSRWRIELEPKKSNHIIFSRCPSHRKFKLKLKLHGEEIKETDNLKFLGVRFDNRLDWSKQIEDLINKTEHTIHLLKTISAKNRWANPREVMKLFDTLVSSTFSFAMPCCITMKSSLWAKIEGIHARTMKSIAGVPNFVSYSRVGEQLSIEKWSSFLKTTALKRIEGIIKSMPGGDKMMQDAPIERQDYNSPVAMLIADKEATRARQN